MSGKNRLQSAQQVANLLLTVSNINWKGLKNMTDAPIFQSFRKWLAGKTFVIVIIALAVGALSYGYASLAHARKENALLATQVEVLTRARAADKLALAAREAGRAEAAAEYAEADKILSDGAQAAPVWAAEKLPPGIVEGLR